MSNATMRIALIGAGYIASYHGRGIIECERAELKYVVSRSGRSGERLAGELGRGEPVTDVDQVITDPGIDAVVIATPNGLHEEQSVAALAAGKAVLVDKPMASTLAGARRMVATAEKSGGILQVGHMWRHDLEVDRIRREIGEGSIGRVYRTGSYGIHERWGPNGWFTDPDLAGGGALLDMGVHAIDTTRYLIGDPEPISVYARISNEHGPPGVDDTGILVISWNNGVVSTVESGWWQPKAEAPEAATRLYGTGGFASLFPTYWETIDLKAARGDDGDYPDPIRTQPNFPERREHCDQRIYSAQIDAFVKAAASRQGGTEQYSRPAWEPGIVVMRIVDAAYRSEKTGNAIHLTPAEDEPGRSIAT